MKKILIIMAFFLFIFLLMAFSILVVNSNFDFKLIGESNILVEVKSNYVEKGYKATLFGKSLNDKVKVDSNLKMDKIGVYRIKYKLKFLGTIYELIRKINVVDKQPPVITLNGDSIIYLNKGDKYIENGVIVQDNYDKDLTNKVFIENNINNKKVGEYDVNYTVKDSSDNKASIKRKVIVINPNNEITINNPMVKYIVDNNYDISFGYYNLVTGDSYLYNEEKVYYAASLIKTVEALYLYDNNMVNDDIKTYIKKAITVSDNPSHHYLQSVIGRDNLKKYEESLGAKYPLSGSDACGKTTVNDQIIFLKRLYEITKDGNNEELKSWFINNYGNSITFDKNIKIMHKYGLYDHVYHNVGIVLDEEPYIIVILTGIPKGYTSIVNKLSRIVYDYHKSI